MPTKKLVIVESPTKARTIRKFLGSDYLVESCMGHVRDLPKSAADIPEKYKKKSWSSLGVNVDNGFEPIYCIPKTKMKIIKNLKDKLLEADELILATDEDREGESISWHLVEVLKPKIPYKRMVFHEITKSAIQKSLKDFREIDSNLVKAQEARRVLDRLVGYTISPLLWKKVAYGLSAGRVQSVAMTLISERELQRLRFKKSGYWSLQAKNEKNKIDFESRLLSYKGKRLAVGKDFSSETGKLKTDKKDLMHLQETQAKEIKEYVSSQSWVVLSAEEKPMSRNPSPPFITSTLQQEASRKLNLSSRDSMQVAQKLYEKGFITYMRTDSTNLSEQAIKAARKEVESLYGKNFLPDSPRTYLKKKVKGAQEAHEAIRPAGEKFVHPQDTGLSGAQQSLYELIWKRTMASQMKNSEHLQMSVKFSVGDCVFSSSGMTVEFPGFLKAYVEGSDDPNAVNSKEIILPKLKKGDSVNFKESIPLSHETKPPVRYTEASLIQKMEQDGIGRPSTYASIISTIQSRGYVEKIGNALTPTFTAMVVSKLLCNYLPDYVNTAFTSKMEDTLDDIANGNKNGVEYLNEIYFGGNGLKNQVEESDGKINTEDSRAIELDGLSGFSFRVGRYGAYVCRIDKKTGEEVCASLALNYYPGDITKDMANKLIDQKIKGVDALGKDKDGVSIYALTGRYGPYVQLGDSGGGKEKPKRVSIPPPLDIETITLEEALNLLSLPKTLGEHPDTEKPVKVGLGRFGPYVVHDGDFRSIPKSESLFEMDFAKALELLAQPKKTRGRAAPIKTLKEHPDVEEVITVHTGKYGPYIKCGKVNVSIPDGLKPEDVTMENAIELLAPKLSEKKIKKKASSKKKGASKKKVASKKKTSSSVAKTSKKKVIRRKKT